jgi:hypothetical protein
MVEAFTPVWLDPDDVAEWLRKRSLSADDQVLLDAVCVQTEAYVQRCRPEFDLDPEPPDDTATYTPDGETYQGAVMYAARQYRRRNSPSGTEQFAGGGAIFTAQVDDDINRALRTGPYTVPGFG